jgi:RNA polymerase-binding transcription factor DksA
MALTETQRKHLEGRLLEERARHRQDLDRSRALQEEDDALDRAGDPLGADRIDVEVQQSNETRISTELEEIDAALERLYQTPERFGICEDTGRPIPFVRLEIIPWARTCDQAGA